MDILFSISTDNGNTWKLPYPLNNNASIDSEIDNVPQISTDDLGLWIAIWKTPTNDIHADAVYSLDILLDEDSDGLIDSWETNNNLNTLLDDASLDPDSDGLNNLEEFQNYTDPHDDDSDDDGLSDSDEVNIYRTSPNHSDTDKDLIPDGWEVDNELNPLINDASLDPDIDNLTNIKEYQNGTDPQVDDTDNDGLLDGTEVNSQGTDPLDYDSDDDGLNDGDEVNIHSSDPLNKDTDNDGFNDGTEVTTGTDPTDINDFVAFPSINSLNNNASSDSGIDDEPQLTTDGSGNWIATWHSTDTLGGTIGADYDILYSLSTDNGTSWGTPTALNSNAVTDSGNDLSPQLTTDGLGTWIATWVSTDTLGNTIGTDGDILYAVSTDNGLNWTFPLILNTNATSDTGLDDYPQITTNGTGNWTVAWESTDSLGATIGADSDILYAVSSNNGTTWSAPAILNIYAASDSGDDVDVQLTTDGAGRWIATWSSTDTLSNTIGTDGDILYSFSTGTGTNWNTPTPLNSNASTDGGSDFNPQITTNGSGTWIATWVTSDSLGSTIGFDWDILYSISTNNGTSWSPIETINSNAGTDSGNDQRPQLTTDELGTWVATWYSSDTLGATTGSDNDILKSVSTDNGANWSVVSPLNSNASTDIGDDEYQQLTTDGLGTWITTWSSNENLSGSAGTDWDILYSVWAPLDTDSDGMHDDWEQNNGIDFTIDDTLGDADSDDLTNLEEYLLETDPQDSDTDNDDMPDGWEVDNELNPLINDAGLDPDIDTLTNLEEYQNGTDPQESDTDGDGLSDSWELDNGLNPTLKDTDNDGMWDGWELTNALNPLINDADIDSDSDGLTNLEEFQYLTNPHKKDTDNDGYSDELEVYMGSDPNDINIIPPPNSEIWADLSAGVNGDGSEGSPFNILSSAETNIATGGRLYVVGGIIDVPYTFTKEMSLQ